LLLALAGTAITASRASCAWTRRFERVTRSRSQLRQERCEELQRGHRARAERDWRSGPARRQLPLETSAAVPRWVVLAMSRVQPEEACVATCRDQGGYQSCGVASTV